MKKTFFLLVMLFPLLTVAQEQNKYFYYYKGKKQYLELNTDYVFIASSAKQVPKKYSKILDNSTELKQDNAFNRITSKENFNETFWGGVKLMNKLSNKDYLEFIKNLKALKTIQIVSPYFKTKNVGKIGLSNFFYVKLKHLSDTALLNKQAVKYSCIVVKQDKFMPLWFVLSTTKTSDMNALELANVFYESNLFQYAEPDFIVEDIVNCGNDEFFSQQWGLQNNGQSGGLYGVDINACKAWDITKGANVVVAVVDQGIELNHPDLKNNIYPLSYDTESSSLGSLVRGRHGTACAGIIGADDNNIGTSGVAPDCRLMSISNYLASTLMSRNKRGEGINWAVNNGADIINNSWTIPINNQIIDDAITNALNNGRNGLGCVVVFASGNKNKNSVEYPSSTPGVISVGAIDRCGFRAGKNDYVPNSCDPWFDDRGSSYGGNLSLVAPGSHIYTTDRMGNNGYNYGNVWPSDISNRDYTANFGGTSAAAPHVAGVAALILSVRPDLTGQQVKNLLEQTAKKVKPDEYSYTTHSNKPNGTWNKYVGYGLVDAYAAVNQVAPRITGAHLVCNQSTYSITNFPEGASVQWSTSNSNLQLISGQGTSEAVFKKKGNGSCIVRATISAYGNNIPLEKTVWVGKPFAYTAGFNPTVCVGVIPNENYMLPFSPGADNYFMSCNSPGLDVSIAGITNTGVAVDIFAYMAGNYQATLKTTNQCGYTTTSAYITAQNCGGGGLGGFFAVYPNPAGNDVTIRIPQSSVAASKGFSKEPYYIQIWDKYSLVKTIRTKSLQTEIPISSLKTGYYYVVVIINGKKYKQQFFKQ